MFIVVDGLETHYLQWTGYSGVTFLPLRCGFTCPVTSTDRGSGRHLTISEDWFVVHHILKSDNWPHVLRLHRQFGMLFQNDLYPFNVH
jgi:hypothetical protein